MSNELAAHYALLLGLEAPWVVGKVDLQMAQRRVVIEVALAKGAKVLCPECGKACGLYDQGEERTWRHLDTMQFETRLRARVPRSNCPEEANAEGQDVRFKFHRLSPVSPNTPTPRQS